ncbi:hypothetical protein K1719_018975 [Acacia pycnantha]|nr:hypothetical protein K1719_018975 [Acacia pycnantha]
MNPLTLVKRIQNINSKEALSGIGDEASWHAKYKDSAYLFVGGIPFDLTEGDLLAVFAQKKRKMKRQRGRKGRNEVFAELSREVNAHVELAANFLMMSKELQTQVGGPLRIWNSSEEIVVGGKTLA